MLDILDERLELLDDKVAFIFLENMANKTFKSVTKSGIILAEKAENQVGKARWAKVLLTGPDVKELEVGDFILIEPLRWTTALDLDNTGEEFWMTDEKSVMAVSKEYPE